MPVHSPLLKQSRLLAVPPLSDMLKFGGSLQVHQVTSSIILCVTLGHTGPLHSLATVCSPQDHCPSSQFAVRCRLLAAQGLWMHQPGFSVGSLTVNQSYALDFALTTVQHSTDSWPSQAVPPTAADTVWLWVPLIPPRSFAHTMLCGMPHVYSMWPGQPEKAMHL